MNPIEPGWSEVPQKKQLMIDVVALAESVQRRARGHVAKQKNYSRVAVSVLSDTRLGNDTGGQLRVSRRDRQCLRQGEFTARLCGRIDPRHVKRHNETKAAKGFRVKQVRRFGLMCQTLIESASC